MKMQLSKRNGMKNNVMWLNIRCFFFLIVFAFTMGSMELKAEETEAGNPGVERAGLEMHPGSSFGFPVWESLPGVDEWVYNYAYISPNLTNLAYVMEYGKMTLKAYPDDKTFSSRPGWTDWKVHTEWIVSGDADIVMLANEDMSLGYEKVPGTGRPDGTGHTVGYYDEDEVYYEENAVIIPTGKPGTCTISAKVVDKNGTVFTLPGKKITVKRWLDVNPDIRVIETATGKAVYGFTTINNGDALSGADFNTYLYTTYYYTGQPITPEIVLTDKGKTLEPGKDYKVSYENNVDVGYWTLSSRGARILITGCGDYAGTVGIPFSIYPNLNNQTPPETQPEPEQKLSCTGTYKKALDSKPFKINVKNTSGKVSFTSSNKKVAAVNSNGMVTIKGTGLAKITVKASNGKAVSKVYVAPKKASIGKAKSTAKKTISLTWKKDTKASGYEIQCNTNKKFKSGNKTVTVKKAKTTSAKISKLKSGKKYYVRMRAYKTIEGKKYAGSWSKVMTVKVK